MKNHFGIADRTRHHPSDSVTNPVYRVSYTQRYFSQTVLTFFLGFAVLFSVPGCSSLRLNSAQKFNWTYLTMGPNRPYRMDMADSTLGTHSASAPLDDAPKPERQTRRRLAMEELKLNLPSRLLFCLTVGLLHVLSLLPDFILYPLGILIGYAGCQLDRRRRKVGMRNLAIAFPERARRNGSESFAPHTSITAAARPSTYGWVGSSTGD
jgi:hypothetical protein